MPKRLKMRREGAAEWLLSDAVTGRDVGGISYRHAADGNHYRPWLIVESTRQPLDGALPQLQLAARAIEDALRST